jgi:hypothetical protein
MLWNRPASPGDEVINDGLTRRGALGRISRFGLAATATAGLASLVDAAKASALCACSQPVRYAPFHCCGGNACPSGSCCYLIFNQGPCVDAPYFCAKGHPCTSGWTGNICITDFTHC